MSGTIYPKTTGRAPNDIAGDHVNFQSIEMGTGMCGAQGDLVWLSGNGGSVSMTAGSANVTCSFGSTTTTAAVTSTGSQTVTVASSGIFNLGSTSNQFNDLGYVVARGASDQEIIYPTASTVGSPSVTAVFSQTHASGVTIEPVVFVGNDGGYIDAYNLTHPAKHVGVPGAGSTGDNRVIWYTAGGLSNGSTTNTLRVNGGASIVPSQAGTKIKLGTFALNQSGANGAVAWVVYGGASVSALTGGSGTIVYGSVITSITVSGGSLIIGLNAGHGFSLGDLLSVMQVSGLTGYYAITAVTSTSATITATYGGSYVSGGVAAHTLLPNNTAGFNYEHDCATVFSPFTYAFYGIGYASAVPNVPGTAWGQITTFGYHLTSQITAIVDPCTATLSTPASHTVTGINGYQLAFMGTANDAAWSNMVNSLTQNPPQFGGPNFAGRDNHGCEFAKGNYLFLNTIHTSVVRVCVPSSLGSVNFVFDPAMTPDTLPGSNIKPQFVLGDLAYYDRFGGGAPDLAIFGGSVPGATNVMFERQEEGCVLERIGVNQNSLNAFVFLNPSETVADRLWVPGGIGWDSFPMPPMRLTASVTPIFLIATSWTPSGSNVIVGFATDPAIQFTVGGSIAITGIFGVYGPYPITAINSGAKTITITLTYTGVAPANTITCYAVQNIAVNRTGSSTGDCLQGRGVTELWVGALTKQMELVSNPALIVNDTTVAFAPVNSHASGAAIWVGKDQQAYGARAFNVNGSNTITNCTFNVGGFNAGWGIGLDVGFLQYGMHFESTLIGSLNPYDLNSVSGNHNSGVLALIEAGVQDCKLRNFGAYSFTYNYYNVNTGSFDNTYAMSSYQGTNLPNLCETTGPSGSFNFNYNNGGLLVTPTSTRCSYLEYSDNISGRPPLMRVGNTQSSGRMSFGDGGTSGRTFAMVTNDSGTAPTFPTAPATTGMALRIDKANISTIIAWLMFGDGGGLTDSGGYLLPALHFGNEFSTFRWRWRHTGTSGTSLFLDMSNNSGASYFPLATYDGFTQTLSAIHLTSSDFTSAGQIAKFDGNHLAPASAADIRTAAGLSGGVTAGPVSPVNSITVVNGIVTAVS